MGGKAQSTSSKEAPSGALIFFRHLVSARNASSSSENLEWVTFWASSMMTSILSTSCRFKKAEVISHAILMSVCTSTNPQDIPVKP